MLGLRHVALRVRDIHQSIGFYRDVLNMKIEWQPDPKNVYLTSGSDNLALHEIDSSVPEPASNYGLARFADLDIPLTPQSAYPILRVL